MTLTSNYAIEATKLTKTYGEGHSAVYALRGVDVKIPKGQVTLITGPSGSGKTTLLLTLSGLLQPDQGEVIVGNKLIHQMSSKELQQFRLQHIGFVFQGFNLVPTLTALENVSIPALLQNHRQNEANQIAHEMLVKSQLPNRDAAYPAQLSGGEKQRVAIARALVTEPNIILCDEPTSALDKATGQAVMTLLTQMAHDENKTLIVVTHDNRIFHFADNLISMEDGKIIHHTSPQELES
jgi:putative ABC transport system ATP-binding protein